MGNSKDNNLNPEKTLPVPAANENPTDGFFRTTLDNLLEGCQIIGFDWRYLYLNKSAELHNRRPNSELIGKRYTDMWPGIGSTKVYSEIRRSLEERITVQLENMFIYPKGDMGWFNLSIQPVPDGVLILSYDITERKEAERQLAQMKRLYATLSQVNQMVVRVKDTSELYQSICELAVKYGEFSLAWVGLLDEESGEIRPVEAEGLELTEWPFSIVNTRSGPLKDGLSAMAIHTSRVLTSEDIQTDTRTQPVRAEIMNYKFHSSASMPFRTRGKTIGVLNLVSNEEGFFKSIEEIHLLEEMSLDISFALDKIKTEAEHKEAERIVRENETRLSAIFIHSPVGIVITRLSDGKILDVNPAFAEIHGYHCEEMKGHSAEELGIWADIAERQSLLKIMDQQESCRNIEIAFKRKNGETGSLMISVELIDLDGEKFMLGLGYDITERRRIEKNLQESERLFASTFQSSPIPISISDLNEGKWVEVNDAFLTVTGYTRDEVIGHSYLDINLWKHADERNRMREILRKQGRVTNLEVEIITKNGNTGIMLISVEKVELSGKPYLLIMGNEITERKKAEQELQFNNILLSTQQEVSLDGILVVDDKARILSFNSRFIEMWGVPRELIKARVDEPVLQFVSGLMSDPQDFLGRVQFLFENKHATSQDELQLRDGRIAERYSAPMFRSGDEYLGRVWYFRDISGRKEAEAEIKKLNAELENRVRERTAQLEMANRELEAFSYSVSHDLRAPLRGINGLTEILVEDYSGKLDDKGREICSMITKSSGIMEQLINDLLAFSKLSRTEMQHTVIQMKRLVNTVYNEITDPESRERIEMNIGELGDSQGDPTMIRQVWINLISNAIKYSRTREKAVITITCRKAKDFCVYCIKDNGVGFNMKFADKLFGVFQRLHSAKEFEGTGVGLAIVQRIILRHGGEIHGESEQDKGAAFYFSLPKIEPVDIH